MGAKATTQVTFAVTFTLPDGMTIAAIREDIKKALIKEIFADENEKLKIHLTNKEISYGKR